MGVIVAVVYLGFYIRYELVIPLHNLLILIVFFHETDLSRPNLELGICSTVYSKMSTGPAAWAGEARSSRGLTEMSRTRWTSAAATCSSSTRRQAACACSSDRTEGTLSSSEEVQEVYFSKARADSAHLHQQLTPCTYLASRSYPLAGRDMPFLLRTRE